MNQTEQSWKFWVPISTIEKAKGKDGKEKLRIGGVASTMDRDTDGQILDPNGFDLDYLTKYGFFNWHHQSKSSPAAIVGEPDTAIIKNNELYVEGELYPELDLAKNIYDLAILLKKRNSQRRLGFSVEGKTLQTDSIDKNFIKKARITGIAITPMPKNSFTYLDIVKGHYDAELQAQYDDEEEKAITTLVANGGDTYIIDITKPNGDRITVDTNFNVKIISKALTTDTGRALIRADVEGHPKKVIQKAILTVYGAYQAGKIDEKELERIKPFLRN